MNVLRMHYMIAGIWLASLLTITGCSSTGSCCGRNGQCSAGATAAPVVAVPNAAVSAAAPQMAQKKCPVTDEDLGSMGSPIAVQVKGETIYVCCQGCVKKVQQNPDAYLAKVTAERNASR